MDSYYLSTPQYTVRVDVEDGIIQRSTARYLWRAYGQEWEPWLAQQQRRFGTALTVEHLSEPQSQSRGY